MGSGFESVLIIIAVEIDKDNDRVFISVERKENTPRWLQQTLSGGSD